jgi:hypothetical protein
MKHSKWRETLQEKILFMSARQLQDHREKALAPPTPPTRSAPRAAGFHRSGSHHLSPAGEPDRTQSLPLQRSVDGWWITRLQLGLGNYHYRYPIDGKPAFDLHAIKLVHNEFYEPISLLAVI